MPPGTGVKFTSKFGAAILAKYGWKEGDGLGRQQNGILDPVRLKAVKENSGLGQKEHDQWHNWWDDMYNEVARKAVKVKSASPKKCKPKAAARKSNQKAVATKQKPPPPPDSTSSSELSSDSDSSDLTAADVPNAHKEVPGPQTSARLNRQFHDLMQNAPKYPGYGENGGHSSFNECGENGDNDSKPDQDVVGCSDSDDSSSDGSRSSGDSKHSSSTSSSSSSNSERSTDSDSDGSSPRSRGYDALCGTDSEVSASRGGSSVPSISSDDLASSDTSSSGSQSSFFSKQESPYSPRPSSSTSQEKPRRKRKFDEAGGGSSPGPRKHRKRHRVLTFHSPRPVQADVRSCNGCTFTRPRHVAARQEAACPPVARATSVRQSASTSPPIHIPLAVILHAVTAVKRAPPAAAYLGQSQSTPSRALRLRRPRNQHRPHVGRQPLERGDEQLAVVLLDEAVELVRPGQPPVGHPLHHTTPVVPCVRLRGGAPVHHLLHRRRVPVLQLKGQEGAPSHAVGLLDRQRTLEPLPRLERLPVPPKEPRSRQDHQRGALALVQRVHRLRVLRAPLLHEHRPRPQVPRVGELLQRRRHHEVGVGRVAGLELNLHRPQPQQVALPQDRAHQLLDEPQVLVRRGRLAGDAQRRLGHAHQLRVRQPLRVHRGHLLRVLQARPQNRPDLRLRHVGPRPRPRVLAVAHQRLQRQQPQRHAPRALLRAAVEDAHRLLQLALRLLQPQLPRDHPQLVEAGVQPQRLLAQLGRRAVVSQLPLQLHALHPHLARAALPARPLQELPRAVELLVLPLQLHGGQRDGLRLLVLRVRLAQGPPRRLHVALHPPVLRRHQPQNLRIRAVPGRLRQHRVDLGRRAVLRLQLRQRQPQRRFRLHVVQRVAVDRPRARVEPPLLEALAVLQPRRLEHALVDADLHRALHDRPRRGHELVALALLRVLQPVGAHVDDPLSGQVVQTARYDLLNLHSMQPHSPTRTMCTLPLDSSSLAAVIQISGLVGSCFRASFSTFCASWYGQSRASASHRSTESVTHSTARFSITYALDSSSSEIASFHSRTELGMNSSAFRRIRRLSLTLVARLAASTHTLTDLGTILTALASTACTYSGFSRRAASSHTSSRSPHFSHASAMISRAFAIFPASSSTRAAAIHPDACVGFVAITDLSSVRAFLMSATSLSLLMFIDSRSVRYPLGSTTVCPPMLSVTLSSVSESTAPLACPRSFSELVAPEGAGIAAAVAGVALPPMIPSGVAKPSGVAVPTLLSICICARAEYSRESGAGVYCACRLFCCFRFNE
ncbi:G-patch domain-containing protein [Babesia caballi]|uniref:G-patch domain-containing protein n=1 Tax=Babesia caballi TaxID=5871 RepID=A0AAV4LWQ0_BABCB|nr:G-patch domain-containing protein [Babesia caballi]